MNMMQNTAVTRQVSTFSIVYYTGNAVNMWSPDPSKACLMSEMSAARLAMALAPKWRGINTRRMF
jgi:hypothetical protein